jgi:hypothetical protein
MSDSRRPGRGVEPAYQIQKSLGLVPSRLLPESKPSRRLLPVRPATIILILVQLYCGDFAKAADSFLTGIR